MRQEQAVNLFGFEFFDNLQPVFFIVEQAFFINIIDIDEGDSQLFQLLFRQSPILDGIGSTENAAPGRCIT